MTKKLFVTLAAIGSLAVAPAVADCPLVDPADCTYVDDDCVADPGTGTETDPFCRIQDAYDAVFAVTSPAAPVTILVREGTYPECVIASGFDPDLLFNEDRPVRVVADAWLLAGQPAPNPADTQPFEDVAMLTMITGLGTCDGVGNTRGPAIAIGGSGAALQGFAITKGGDSGVDARGGVDVTHNLVFGNQGLLGGGIGASTETCVHADVTATISNNVVRDNIALDWAEFGGGDGGGIFAVADGTSPDAGICLGGRSDLTIADNVVHDNTAQNSVSTFETDSFAGGGGISVETATEFPAGAVEDSQARVLVSGNTVFGNSASPGAGLFAFGAGVFASTLGFGMETVEVEGNTLGPNNVATSSGDGAAFGGGLSTSATPLQFGYHELTVRDNTVTQNAADVGGGIDLLAIAQSLDTDQRLVVTVANNTIENNASQNEGGGVNAEFNSERSLDVEDEANLFPGAPLVAEELTFVFRGNVLRNNTAGSAGAGIVLRPSADADPLSPEFCIFGEQRPATAIIDFDGNYLEGNTAQSTAGVGGRPGCSDALCEAVICSGDSFCCDVEWDQVCADAAAADPVNCDCDTSNCCDSSLQEVIGAGILAIPSAKGEALAAIEMTSSTLVDNTMTADGFVGGVELASVTLPDCFDNFTGATELNVDRCIIAFNHADGIGGPAIDAGVTDQTVTVIKSSVFGNGDGNPNNDPDLNYEDTLFPAGPPDGNILDDPLLDPSSFVPDLCSPVYDVGVCEAEPATICLSDNDCTAPDVCLAEGAGYLASPDLNDDDALDGIDLMRFSTTFGAEDGVDARYNPDADIDRSGQVDGADLPFIAPLFGQECTEGP
jgi:hypothetical protein